MNRFQGCGQRRVLLERNRWQNWWTILTGKCRFLEPLIWHQKDRVFWIVVM
uniref:E3 SUMO-protein ligase SIZ1-like n=1 Tax=Rhizophora mucronata TaxID=61149 RepID=A0A2P2KGJ5_RHIMU